MQNNWTLFKHIVSSQYCRFQKLYWMSQRNWPGTYFNCPATRPRYCICWWLFHFYTDCHEVIKIHIHTRSLQRKNCTTCDDKQILSSYQWTSRILRVDLCKAGGNKQNFMDLEIGNDMVLTEWILVLLSWKYVVF